MQSSDASERLARLQPGEGTLLHRAETEHHPVEVRQLGALRWLHFGGPAIQSVVDVEHPARPLQPYVQAMLGGLLFCPQPRGALVLGSGGATLERFLAAQLPHLPVTSVERSRTLIALARRYFFLPRDWPVVCDSAAAQLGRHATPCDLLLCDLYAADHHPPELFDTRFHGDAARRLGPGGVLVINLLPNAEQLQQLLLSLRRLFPRVALLEFADQRNIVVYACKRRQPGGAQLAGRIAAARRDWGLDLAVLEQRLLVLPEGGA